MKTALEHGRAWARAVEDPQGRRPPIVYSEQLPHTLFPARPSAQSGSGAAVLSGRACAAQLEPASGSSSALLSPPAPGRRPRSVFQTKPGGGGRERWDSVVVVAQAAEGPQEETITWEGTEGLSGFTCPRNYLWPLG